MSRLNPSAKVENNFNNIYKLLQTLKSVKNVKPKIILHTFASRERQNLYLYGK